MGSDWETGSKIEKEKVKHDEEEERKSKTLKMSSGDEEANEELSLNIVEKSESQASENGQDNANLNPSLSALIKEDEDVRDEKKQELEKETEKSSRVEAEDGDSVVVYKDVEKADDSESLKIDNLVEGKDDVSENMVLRKLLRGPRYFDPPDSSWGACHNCGEGGHTTVNCSSAKRMKPCFVCGSLGHNARQCTKGKDCFICKRGGHRAKDCPQKKIPGELLSAKICLKCGQSGHGIFSCKSDYSSDDLKEIQCYICKSFGHLCCAKYTGTAAGVLSCYRCGQSGHTGLECTRLPGEPNDMESPSSCYRCGEGGHFARECTSSPKACTRLHGEPNNMGSSSSCYRCGKGGHFARECTSSVKVCTRMHCETNGMGLPGSCYRCGEGGHFARNCTTFAKNPKRNRELSTPRPKRSKQDSGGRFLSREPCKANKKRKMQYEGHSTPSKSKNRGGWITEDPGDYSPHRHAKNKRKSPATPHSKIKKFSNSTVGMSHSRYSRKLQKCQLEKPASCISKHDRGSTRRLCSSNNDGKWLTWSI